jgi:hypothetical protein
MDGDDHCDDVNVPKGSFAPIDWTLVRLHETCGWDDDWMWRRCKHLIVWPCNITFSRNCIKHLNHLFDSSQWIHVVGNGILSGGWWLWELCQLDEKLISIKNDIMPIY